MHAVGPARGRPLRSRSAARRRRARRRARFRNAGGEIPYTVRRSARARRVRVNVHAHAGVEVVLPARAPERAAAAAVNELRPWIERRLGEAHDALARIAARAGTVPYLGSALELVPAAGPHARAPRRRAAARARRRRPPGARALLPARSARGDRARAWTAPPRSRAAPTATCRSARSARAGRRARPTGG